ncbi:MAG: hypothetical protein ACRCWR_04340 [Saezia sp.]
MSFQPKNLESGLSLDKEFLLFEHQLKEKMVVFDAIVFHVEEDGRVDEALHRHVLRQLFAKVEQEEMHHIQKVMEKAPGFNANQFFRIRCDIDAAQPVFLTHDPLKTSDGFFEWFSSLLPLVDTLFQMFESPPYSIQMSHDEAKKHYATWQKSVGLVLEDDPEVVDWVGLDSFSPDECTLDNPRSQWSNYFDAGKGWWGFFCFTIYNAKQKTLSAVMASTTD